MRSPDIADRLANLRENLSPEVVRTVAAHRAGMWDWAASRHAAKLPEFAVYCQETARQWREAAEA
jgi:hypothetical protein